MRKIVIILTICFATVCKLFSQDPYITTPGPYGQTFMSYQLSENILYSGTSRYRITSTVDSGNVSMLVNGKYEETAVTVPAGQSATITIDFQGKGGSYVQSPSGYIYLNFYDTFYPDTLTATIYDSTGGDDGIEWVDWSNVSTTSPYLLFRAHIPDWMAGLKKIEIRVKSRAGVATKVSEVEYILQHPGQFESGLVNKWADNTLWSKFTMKDTANATKITLDNLSGAATFQQLYIGTANSKDTNAKVFVEGSVRARKMEVNESNWPDYVFSKNYRLPSLQEIQQFIKENNHLPGIPSAAEVEAKGLDIGKNQSALMQKVEELTLYLINQNEQILKQNEQIKVQQEQINELKNLLQQKIK